MSPRIIISNCSFYEEILSKYVESLESCYDESYFYDSELNITIFKYYVEDESPFNKIFLKSFIDKPDLNLCQLSPHVGKFSPTINSNIDAPRENISDLLKSVY